MNRGAQLGLRALVALAATLLFTPIAAAFLPTIPFHRVFDRVFLVSLIGAFAIRSGGRSGWVAGLRAHGLRGPDRLRRVLSGLALALALMAGMIALAYALGGRALRAVPYDKPWAVHLLESSIAAVLVSFLEEVIFRGYLKDVLGGIAAAAIYGVAHYFHPSGGSAPAHGYHPLAAVFYLPHLFEGFTHLRDMTLGLGSLFLLGLALNKLRDRTQSLYLGIGLHAGLVFSILYYRQFLDENPSGNPWIYGGPRLHDGALAAGLIALLLVATYVVPIPEFLRRGRISRNPPHPPNAPL